MKQIFIAITLLLAVQQIKAQQDSSALSGITFLHDTMSVNPFLLGSSYDVRDSIQYFDWKLYVRDGDDYKSIGLILDDTCAFRAYRADNQYLLRIGKDCIRRTYSHDYQRWAFVFTTTTQKTCDYCIHFDFDGNDLWIEPDGRFFWNGKMLYKDMGQYLFTIHFFLQLEDDALKQRYEKATGERW